MSKINKVAKSAVIIIILSLLSKGLGFFREVLIASNFGSGKQTDAFFIAMTATALLSGFLSNAVSTTFIPVLSEIETKEGKQGKIYHANNMINIMVIFSAVLVIVAWIFSPYIVKILAKGFNKEQLELSIQLTKIGLPVIIFGGINGIFTGFLQSEQKFISTAAAGFPFNFVYIIFLIFLSERFGIKGLMVASVIAVGSQLLIQIPEAISSGYRYMFKIDFKDNYVKKVILLSFPVLIGVAINDLNAIIDRSLASSLDVGSISALNYANKLNGLILGVFISAITTVIFPLLSQQSNSNNIKGMKRTMSYGINLIFVITIPATIGLIVLSEPIVELAFKRGAFDANATIMTSQSLIFYSIGLIAMSINLLLNRVYYSLQDTKTPMINGSISVGFNIIFNIILIKYMKHSGLALATSLSATISTLMLLYGLKKKIGCLGIKDYINTFIKSGTISMFMGLVIYLIYSYMNANLGISKLYNAISLGSSLGIGLILYLILCYVFNIKILRDIGNDIIMKLTRNK